MSPMWSLTPLGDVLTERREQPTSEDLESGRTKIVEKISFNTGRIQLRAGGSTKTGMILAYPGDLVVSGINAAKGAIAICDEAAAGPVAATIHYGAYVPNRSRVDVYFLWWMLRSQLFKELLLEYVPGGIKTELKPTRLLPIPVPLPSLDEQRRVVARIEELAARVGKARELRQESAVETDALLSSSVSTLGFTSSTRMRSLGQIVGVDALRNGKSVKSADATDGIRCLTLSSMRGGRIDLNNSKPVPLTSVEAAPFLVRLNDVFIVRGNGSKELCGLAGRVDQEASGVIFPDLFIRVPIPPDQLIPEFFVRVWNSTPIREIIKEKAKTTSGIWKVNQGHITSTSVPVPPLTDQRRIVSELDALQAQIDALKHLQAESAAELNALLPSVLDRAFRGEL